MVSEHQTVRVALLGSGMMWVTGTSKTWNVTHSRMCCHHPPRHISHSENCIKKSTLYRKKHIYKPSLFRIF
jgi:hypothetical protein